MEGFSRRPEISEELVTPRNNPENTDGKGIEADHTRTIEGLDDTASVSNVATDPLETEQSNVSVETNFNWLSAIYRIIVRNK